MNGQTMKEGHALDPALKQELFLFFNERLLQKGSITKEIYEMAKLKILDMK